jgi:hypothetical protein
MNEPEAVATPITDYIHFAIGNDLSATLHISAPFVLAVALVGLLLFGFWRLWLKRRFPAFTIDEAEFGFGDQKIKFKPNDLDRTVAYRIWVELSTRKIGLEIDPDHDVIDEIYDSWFTFFGVTRELIKEVPVSRVRNDSTTKIIKLSISVLNEGLRPHLTKWQARFRRWYKVQLERDAEATLHPQDIQKSFPQYQELVSDMLEVNKRLIRYRSQMRALVDGT